MAETEKNRVEYYPQALNGNGFHGGDHESLLSMVKDEKRRKRIKWAVYASAFTVFQVMVILVFALMVMKVKSPKYRVGAFVIKTINTDKGSPSFNVTFVVPVRIKNPNFGPYKFEESTIDFTYGGAVIGRAVIPKGMANFKSTKKIDVEVSLSLNALSGSGASSKLGSELGNGVITLGSQGKINGKVTLMFVFKKKKSAEMNCTIAIDLTTKAIKSLECKCGGKR